MPRRPAKDYEDRCRAVGLKEDGLSQREIAQVLQRPERWVRRTLKRYDQQVGLESLRDRSSRPHCSPNRTPTPIEEAICELKQAHSNWGRRQISKQLRWQWRDDPAQLQWVSEGRVRRVLGTHPQLRSPPSEMDQRPARQIDYLGCNLLWGADTHYTRLADGTVWETLHWLDLHSRYELGQMTSPCLTEQLVVQSFLAVAGEHGLPQLVKTDGDKLFHEPATGLPGLLDRVCAAVGVVHLVMPKEQPWWNGVVERYIRTCRQEGDLPEQGDAEQVHECMEHTRLFYNQERCHSRCDDRPPATCYHPSERQIPADFVLSQVPITMQPTVVMRQVQTSGRVSLAGRSYPFSRRYAGQAVTVTVDRWLATAQAQDGWQRIWDLHPTSETPAASPPPPAPPKPLTRRVNRRGSIQLSGHLYYLGLAWTGLTLTLYPEGDSWRVSFPDGTTKSIPDPQFLRPLARHLSPTRPQAPPCPSPEPTTLQTRRVTKTGQVSFHNRLYFVGISHRGEQVHVTPISEGLAVYNSDHAWITTCPWKGEPQADKPPCPT